MITPADLDRLEALAWAACDGPWHVERHSTNIECRVPNAGCVTQDGGYYLALVFADGGIGKKAGNANAAFIAAADPSAVLRLIALARKG